MLSTSMFLSIFFGTLGVIFGIMIPFVFLPMKRHLEAIKENVEPIREIKEEAMRIGLTEIFQRRTTEHHSLPPEKAKRKEELLTKGRRYGLVQTEAEELKALLREDAQDDFARGLIGTIAIIGIIALIGAVVSNLTKKR
jgi:uncharacterized membrane protein YgaE (UPF0421/DUF939 family)